MNSRITLVEVLVWFAIVATMLGLLFAPAIGNMPAVNTPSATIDAPGTVLLNTVQHDGHKWVLAWSAVGGGNTATHFEHHPDCPCLARTAASPR